MTTPCVAGVACEILRAQLGMLFECSGAGNYTRVRTPFYYPDGGIVDLYIRKHNEIYIVTDLGESLSWLRLQSLSAKRTSKQQKLLQDVCATLGVEVFKGQIVLRCQDAARLADCVLKMGQAIIRTSDLWFTTRTRAVESMTDEVEDHLVDKKIGYERAVKLTGRSGRTWTVDFHTWTPDCSSLVFILTTGARSFARRATEHVVAGCVDLQNYRVEAPPKKLISLFDDTSDVWGDEEYNLAENVSDTARWSDMDSFDRLLGKVA